MAKINDTGPHSAELVDERGTVFARIEFTHGTNAASRKEELLDGAEHWANGGDGTPAFRLATRLRALLNTKLSTEADSKSAQQTTERRALEALNNYVKFFRDPANASRKRDPSLMPGRKPPPHVMQRRRMR